MCLTAKAAFAPDISVDAPRPELMRKKRALRGSVESSPHNSHPPAYGQIPKPRLSRVSSKNMPVDTRGENYLSTAANLEFMLEFSNLKFEVKVNCNRGMSI